MALKTQKTAEDEDKVSVSSIKQIAAIVGALGVIIGAILTVDNRYAKPEDIEKAKTSLERSINDLHKDILEYEQLRIALGNSVKSNQILLDKNKRELAEVQERLRDSRPLLMMAPKNISIDSAVATPIMDMPVQVDDENQSEEDYKK